VLAGAGLGDHPGLADQLGEQRLPEHVVDLVRAGVVEVLALEEDPHPAGVRGELRHLGDRAGPSGVVPVQGGQPSRELGVPLGLLPRGGQVVQGSDQRLGHEPATEVTEVRADHLAQHAGGLRTGLGGHRVRTARSAGCAPAATMSATAVRGCPWVTSASPTSTTSAPARAYSSTSCGPRTPDSATRTIPCGTRGARSANTPRCTCRVCRSRALMPSRRAPASTARSTSSAAWASTSAVMTKACIRTTDE